jgi:hypothetical protein
MRPCRVLGSQPQKLGGRVWVARCFRQAGKHVRLPPVVVGIGHRNWALYQGINSTDPLAVPLVYLPSKRPFVGSDRSWERRLTDQEGARHAIHRGIDPSGRESLCSWLYWA